MRRASLVALALAAMYLIGCGTAANLSGGLQGWRKSQIYGGVRRDVKSANQFIADNWTGAADIQQDVGTVVGVGLISLDVPFSLIGDTLTLPITIPAALMGGSAAPPPPAATVSGKTNGVPPATNGTVPNTNLAQK
ncbi:MAG TPA: YceK/YidQ family lipoprotein [Gemmataceae bacterium]|jgi:uncharacterized protein YceK